MAAAACDAICEAVRAELDELRDIEKSSATWDCEDDDDHASLETCIEATLCRSSELGWRSVPDGVPPCSGGRAHCLAKKYVTVELRLQDAVELGRMGERMAGASAAGSNRFEYRVHGLWIGCGALCAYGGGATAGCEGAAQPDVTVLGRPVHSEAEAVDAFRHHREHHAPDMEPLVRGGYRALRRALDRSPDTPL